MSRSVPSLAVCSFLLVVGCGGAQRSTAAVLDEPEAEPEAPPPRVEPRVWENQASYPFGWPIRVKVGLINVGESVASLPQGDRFGVRLRARLGDEELECSSLPAGSPRGGLVPLASGSSATRSLDLARRCPFDEPGRYFVELTVELPETEGADFRGAQSPVTVELEVREPSGPLSARLVADERYSADSQMRAVVRVTNRGGEELRLAPASRLEVTLEAASGGEDVPCDPLAPTGRAGARAVALGAGQSIEVPVTLAELCQLTLPGDYLVTPTVVVPAAGPRTFTGTVEGAPALFEVVEAPEGAAPPAPGDDE